MKLWWPHCEALISYLMAYDHLRDPAMLQRFTQVYDYTFTHVSNGTENHFNNKYLIIKSCLRGSFLSL